MSYDRPVRQTYDFAGVSFASSDTTRLIKNPRTGSKGKVMSILAMVTTTCAGATTKPKVRSKTASPPANAPTCRLARRRRTPP